MGFKTNVKESSQARFWWLAEQNEAPGKAQVATRLQNWMNSIEQMSWNARRANWDYYRLMTGRSGGPESFQFASTSRPSELTRQWRRINQAAPRDNVLAQCSDALHARVFSQQPFLFVTPIDGDFNARVKSKKLTRFLDAAFYDLKLWPQIEQAGQDCRTWGTGFIRIDVSRDKKKIEVSRVLSDEVVIDDNELNAGDQPLHAGIRVFANIQSLLDAYGDLPGAEEAILRAPRATNGVVLGTDYDLTQVVVLREAWALPVGDEPGRHVLTCGDYALVDEPYERNHFPLAKLSFNRVGFFGQGMAEMVSGLLRSLEFQLAAIDENHRRASWPRILIAKGSNVNPSSLGDTSNGISHYSGVEPKFVFPNAVSPGQYQYVQYLRDKIKERFRLNDQANSGREPQFKSGEAYIQQDRIADEAHVDLFQHLEDFVEQIGVLVIEAAEICKPTVRLPGRRVQEINWDDVELAKNSYSLRILKLSQLVQSGANKQEKIDQWFAQGIISKAQKMRLEQVPDTEGYATIANSSPDYIEFALDSIMEEGKYIPPEPWLDLGGPDGALATAQSRYLREKMYKDTPRQRLDMILQWIFQVQELMGDVANDNATPMPGAPPGPGFGIQPPAGPPDGLNGQPAPQAAFPIPPAMAPPAPVAATQ